MFVGELSDDVDDYILYHAFKKRYPSCHTAKGRCFFCSHFSDSTVNYLKKSNTLLFLFLNKMVAIRTAVYKKMFVRIANREDPGQTASSEAV